MTQLILVIVLLQEVAALKNLLVELLENGQISESCRLATEFSLYSQDLAIILVSFITKTCLCNMQLETNLSTKFLAQYMKCEYILELPW